MVETLSSAEESRGEVRDGELERAEVGHVELGDFTSSIVGVAGYYPLGRYMYPTGGYHQVIVATEDDKVTELYWRPGETVNQEELYDFSKLSVPSKIAGISAYYSENDGYHHQDVATRDGKLCELYWRPGPGVGYNLLYDQFDSTILGVAAYYVPEDGYHHQDVATEDGKLTELYWRPGPGVSHDVLENFTSRIVGVAAYPTPDGFQHQIVATEDRQVHQLWWRPGSGLNHRILQGFTSAILGVAGYYTPDGYRRVVVATEDGKVTELSWKPAEPIERTELPHGLTTRVVAVAGYFSHGDNQQHVIIATDDRKVHGLHFGIKDDLGYPGDAASKPDVAKWMAKCAEARDLPRELPVTCSLTELGSGAGHGWNEGIRNFRDAYGYSVATDRVSLGFFQQRPAPAANWGCRRENDRCTWEQRLENIMYGPHAITEFLDEAIKWKDQWVWPPGWGGWVYLSNEDESSYGAWCQQVQRSGYPFRYQPQLQAARSLINR